MKIAGNLVDIHNREIYPAALKVKNGKIERIERLKIAPELYIMPGLIDAHIHIESSMITPGAFALAAVKHGTIGVVSDPHEIANILGIRGINFMINDALKVPVKFWFGASSCVPATIFETTGATITHSQIKKLLKRPDIKYLGEMMNYPGVIFNDREVHSKLNAAHDLGKPVDGHAPGLTGEMLKKYISAGITTDHECSTLREAEEKILLGMKILIREGSAAKNLESLKHLFKTNPGMVMLCSDDLHPEMLNERHINKLVAKLINEGYDIFDVIRSVTINPVVHYELDAGLLLPGQSADFILVDKPETMNILETWIEGKRVFDKGKVLFKYLPGKPINKFISIPLKENEIRVENRRGELRIIEAFEGELITREIISSSGIKQFVESDITNDILKIVVKNRYRNTPAAVGFIKGFGLKVGAFSSSIAHDSHNIIAVGTNDEDIKKCINEIIKLKGGLTVSSCGKVESLQLNIGGIMTTRSCKEVAKDYENLNKLVKSMGCKMTAPFMTLSFMALLVIPDLKIGDRGLFDVKKFQLTSLFVE